MKYLLIAFISVFSFGRILAQEYKNTISSDGKFVLSFEHYGIPNTNNAILVQSTNNPWKKEVYAKQLGEPTFSSDNTLLVYTQNQDTLCLLHLGTDQTDRIPGISSFQQPKQMTGQWLAYFLKDKSGQLYLRDVNTGKERAFENITACNFDDKGNTLLLTRTDTGSKAKTSLLWLNLQNSEQTTIWTGEKDQDSNTRLLHYTINPDGTGMALNVETTTTKDTLHTIWYYQNGMQKARLIAGEHTTGLDNNLLISNKPLEFTRDGTRLFLKLKERPLPKPGPKMVKLDVWSYRDAKLQSQQLMQEGAREYTAVISIENPKIIRLEQENEALLSNPSQNNDYALLCHWEDDILNHNRGYTDGYSFNEYNWNRAIKCRIYLVSLKDGERRLLKNDYQLYNSTFPSFRFSPDKRYVIYFDQEKQHYFSYRIADRVVRNVTWNIKTQWYLGNEEERPREFFHPCGWAQGDHFLLIYDHYHDLWKIDPDGKQKPVNVTNGFFRKSSGLKDAWDIGHIEFQEKMVQQDRLIFRALDKKSLEFNYYLAKLGEPNTPTLLLKGGLYHYWDMHTSSDVAGFIFTRQNHTKQPECIYTRDFKEFKVLKEKRQEPLKPLRVATIRWKLPDGTDTYGLLYYPTDFNSQKKYPVIVHYYEGVGFSNEFVPAETVIRSSIPRLDRDYLIANGYFYFTPEIHYKISETAKSVCNSVVLGTKALIKLPYIDPKHMGITGHSFGGYETNILVANTRLFAAAVSGSGLTDMVSQFGTEQKDEQGFSNSATVETGQMRLGVTLWQRPDLYLENSPVFRADEVTTPLLMGIGRKDNRVPVSQGIELFTALRRLGKPCWLISYDDADHGLIGEDWPHRAMQFFDHYLKGTPAPVWMTQGIPARMKGRTLGLELDTIHPNPGPGLKLDKEIVTPQQEKLLRRRTTVNDQGRIVDVRSK